MFFRKKNSGGDVCNNSLIELPFFFFFYKWEEREFFFFFQVVNLASYFQGLPIWCYLSIVLCISNRSSYYKVCRNYAFVRWLLFLSADFSGVQCLCRLRVRSLGRGSNRTPERVIGQLIFQPPLCSKVVELV